MLTIAEALPTQAPALGPGQLGYLRDGRVVLTQDSARAFEQRLAGLRQEHAARRPHEKLRPQLKLKLPNLHADGGLRDVHALRAGRECSQLGDGAKRP
ncbi:MAG TPA: hypothetical protein VEV81_01815 [Pyrinomonadaceae bacterium]|nr:hypothetical protein [Pyrinomonadaceae bacterium]